ncbi:MAG: hypothetical protein WC974_06500, partial [Thermoplasmata archaeon]
MKNRSILSWIGALAVCIAVLSGLIGFVGSAEGAWSTDTTENNAISTVGGNQQNPQLVSDGSGGAIITWVDSRIGGNADIYAQRINSAGTVRWTANGTVICTAINSQSSPQIVSDGSGGAIITWQDSRNGNNDIYAQRINASGEVQWTTDGVAISTAATSQNNPRITSDGSGGAIITWEDLIDETYSGGYWVSNWDIYAQCINASGEVRWTANGVAISTEGCYSPAAPSPQITSDGSGGAIITWHDYRNGQEWYNRGNSDIYAQRINASGAVQWTADGAAISTLESVQYGPQIISDGSGGVIITWEDNRNGNYDIYAQRINSTGTVQWTANGTAISTATDSQTLPQLVSDGSGGAIITWRDNRNGTYEDDIYAQHINSAGTVQWTANGTAISTATDSQSSPQLVSDGTGGAIITWYDKRSGTSNYDIYAQRINSTGTVQWTANGTAISTANNDQQNPQLVSDGSGGAIITWYDLRSVSSYDIYAQIVYSDGTLSINSVVWSKNTTENNVISTASGSQESVQLVSDGLGGAIITWQDYRGASNYDIYAQRINSTGAVQWTADG